MLIAAVFTVVLASCGGDGSDNAFGSDLIDGNDTETDTEISTDLDLGTGSGATFSAGAMSLGSASISAQATTTVSVNIANLASDSELYVGQPLTVSFTSTCVDSENAIITSTVTTETGIAQAVYTDIDCASSDVITASLSSGASATATLVVGSLELGAIAFVSAEPKTIALQGLVGSDLSSFTTVVFKVTDKAGNPVSGQEVSFDVPERGSMGGADYNPKTVTTDGNGLASTIFNSGTVKTTATVIAEASLDGTVLSASSATISISTGVAVQEALSLSIDTFNPLSWDIDGVEVEVTVRASDFYLNPIPDGGKVAFFTSGGQIDDDCTLSSDTGTCSVKWRSQNPRPDNGRVAIMATLKGEETQLTDDNADGLYGLLDTLEPLPEAFLDADWSDNWNEGETYLDTNNNAIGDPARAVAAGEPFKGVRCDSDTECKGLTDIFINRRLVMSDRVTGAGIDLVATPGASTIAINAGLNFIDFIIADFNDNAPGAGTTISAEFTAQEEDEDSLEADTLTVSSSTISPQSYRAVLVGDGNPSSGILVLTVTNTDDSPPVNKYYTVNES
jgi:hypothetical protein